MAESQVHPTAEPIIEYFFSVQSPFAYLAGDRLERLAARRGAAIDYHPLPILKLFEETGGTAPKDRHPSRQRYRLQDLERSAAFAGAPITLRPAHWPVDERLASVALIAAQLAGFAIGPAAAGMLRAVWAEERNIADPDTVAAILGAHGVAIDVITPHEEEAEATFEGNIALAEGRGVFGSPSYVVGEQVFWGQDRLEHLDHFLRDARA